MDVKNAGDGFLKRVNAIHFSIVIASAQTDTRIMGIMVIPPRAINWIINKFSLNVPVDLGDILTN